MNIEAKIDNNRFRTDYENNNKKTKKNLDNI